MRETSLWPTQAAGFAAGQHFPDDKYSPRVMPITLDALTPV
jgi:hypothetical protein